MTRIGILSDTHYQVDDKILKHLEPCDEIWHAGDIGSLEVSDKLAAFKPLKAVYGNIDNHDIRRVWPLINRFQCEDVDVMIKHIVGYPSRYDAGIRETLSNNAPNLLIAGHSHILKVLYDHTHNLLFINPGAAGKQGFHQVRTLVRLTIDGSEMKDLEVVELGKR